MSENSEKDERINELDGLRGMAILAAVLYHYANNLIDADASKFNLLIKSITHFFYTSIDMFFILSGFLLGGILLRNKKSKNFFKTFYIRRICRIVPLYLLLLVSVIVICSLGIGKGTDWWFNEHISIWVYFTFLQNIFIGIYNDIGNVWLGPTWSLGVEEQFYLLISVLIYFSSKRILLILLLIGIVMAPVFRFNAPTVYALSTFTHCRFDALFGGILVALAYENSTFVHYFKSKLKKINFIVLVLFSITFLFSIGKWDMPLFIVNSWFSFLYMLILLLVLTDNTNFITKLSQKKIFINLGLFSFSIYLFHELILGLFFFLIPGKLPQIKTFNDILLVTICAFLTYVTARFLYLKFEKKFMQMGHRFKY